MRSDWREITEKDVVKAIKIFDGSLEEFPPARNTFLIYKGKLYPAKHIRSLAYKVVHGTEISKSEFSGGRETVEFFHSLGFTTKYTPSRNSEENTKIGVIPESAEGKIIKRKVNKPERVNVVPADLEKRGASISIPGKGVIEQKNALQLVLNRCFEGDIVSEKTFDWLITPSDKTRFKYLIDALHGYRGKSGFDKANYKLRCDFVCESKKLIFEYDERQHFSLARKAALESYPEKLPLDFDKLKWISACEQIKAKDNFPPNRDETRAYYDSIRDLLCLENGYRLIRIMHGEHDWNSQEAVRHLEEITGIGIVKQPVRKAIASTLKIGLYIQGDKDRNFLSFGKRLKDVSKQDMDILVFPETCYTTYGADFYGIRISDDDEVMRPIGRALQISEKIGCAVIIGAEDKYGLIYNVYANAFAKKGETEYRIYIKHTMANNSPLGFPEYKDRISDIFDPIILKGNRIGMTICYDCNHSAFSRAWGKQGVDIIINSTGGNVVYQKWHRYNKARSLENKCFSFCTMGYSKNDKINSYAFAFTPNGAQMEGRPIYPLRSEKDTVNNIFIYDTADFDNSYEPDISLDQNMSDNTNSGEWRISPAAKEIDAILKSSRLVEQGLYIYKTNGINLVICSVDGNEIVEPRNILRKLYSPSLSKIPDKRYLIINRWKEHDDHMYDSVLSDILKVRAIENFCAVVYTSPQKSMCFQSGKNKNVQSVAMIDGRFMLDFGRMTGPEAIWKNKVGMKASWRKGYETLINSL